MEYAQLNVEGTEALQITTHSPIEWDANNFCSAEALVKDGKADQFRVVPLIETDPPAFDPATHKVFRDGCEKVGDDWQYKWTVVPLTQQEIDAVKAEMLAAYDQALTAHLDSVAQARNWADRVSLMARAGFAGPWQADAIAFGTWADGCNVIGYQMLADFQNGLIPQPTIAEMLAALPPMAWP